MRYSIKDGAMPFFVLLLIFLFSAPCYSQMPEESPDQVWQVGERRWTVEEEQRFANWVEETIKEDFFLRYGIPTDCADAVYAIRWIYARINQLPAAATTKAGRRIGHWSMDWKHLPTDPEWDRDERFLAALFYLFPRTWTGTLSLDTYPVRISPDSIIPGTLFLVTESHTGIVGHVSRDGSHAHPLQTWESALPVRIQKLTLRYFFSGKPERRAGSGLVRFRWPVSDNGEWKYLPVKEHPFYSEEQYTPGFNEGSADFAEAVARRIAPTDGPPMEKLTKVMGTTIRLLRERVPIVLDGYENCSNGGCPEGSEELEIYNTAGRDELIVSLMDHVARVIELNRLDPRLTKEMMEAIPIKISENGSVTFYQVFQDHLWLAHDPRNSIEARWGLKKCEMIHEEIRTTNDSIAFINRVYRKRDPKYADFSIRQQRHHLWSLTQEWNRGECRVAALRPEKIVRAYLPPKISVKYQGSSKKRCEAIRAEVRATHDSIAFIEKTYRKKDPEYADFSIRQQQHLLGRLNEEWTNAGCGGPPPTPKKKLTALKP
jgi:hypothetical protein